MRATDPSGTRWLVRRRWRADDLGADSHRRRWWRRTRSGRGRAGQWLELVQFGDLAEIPVIGILFAAIALLGLIVAAALFVVPLVLALGELLVLLALGAVGVVAKVVFRHPWAVEARTRDGVHHEWPVVGWRASGAVRRFVADQLTSTGRIPTPDQVAAAALAG